MWPTNGCVSWIILLCTVLSNNEKVEAGMMLRDEHRRAGYAALNYTWPIPDGQIQPNTPGWDHLMRNRIHQIEALQPERRTEKYDGWRSIMQQAVVVPNFTQYGWGVTKAPLDLVQEIHKALMENFDSQYFEAEDACIVGEHKITKVDLNGVVEKALHRLLPYHESWVGVPLTPVTGYGLRLYPNTSQLYMHLDKVETHAIGCILHIDHSVDAKPWPLVIEDLEGITQHVYLKEGDMLLYEAAKLLHGRPIPFEGSWYTSLFLHYAPSKWLSYNYNWAVQYAIPNHWEEVHPHNQTISNSHGPPPPQLTMVETGMIEPDCPNYWCGGNQTATWDGMAKPGVTISSHGVEQVLHLPRSEKASFEESPW